MKARKLKRKIKLKSKIFNFFKNNDIPLKNIDLCVNIPLKNIGLCVNIPLKNIDFAKKYLKNLEKNAIIKIGVKGNVKKKNIK